MMITLPPEINYAEYYFTLNCNLGCPYCINQYVGVVRERPEMSIQQAATGINKINFGQLPLTIGGGEPTMRPDFYELLHAIRPETKIDLLTNLTFDVIKFIKEVPINRFFSTKRGAYKSIRVSYHPRKMDPEELLRKAIILQDAGFSVGVFGINYPESVSYNMEMSEMARKEKIYFFVKDFLGEYKGHLFGYYTDKEALSGIKRKCLCRTKELLISPSGSIHKCHRDLYNGEFPIGDISGAELLVEYKYRACMLFGFCNPCDVKIKTNRFFQMGNSSVEILKGLDSGTHQ